MSPSQKDPSGRDTASETRSLCLNDPDASPGTGVSVRKLRVSTRNQRKDERKVTSPQQNDFGEETTHSRSNSIDDNDNLTSHVNQNRPALEPEQAVKPSETPNLPSSSDLEKKDSGVDCPSYTGSTIGSDISEDQEDASSDLEQEGGSVGCPSDTGSTATDSDASEDQEDGQPLATIIIARPTQRKAIYACLICLILILVLIVLAVTLPIVDCESPSVGIQKSCNLVFQAGTGVISAYIWVLYATQQLRQLLPVLRTVPRHSSGEEFGAGLRHTYTNLSQALAASNSLFHAPALISDKRAEAMRFQLPEGSLTSEPLQLFFRQSVHVDEDLLRLILMIGQTAKLAQRQQQLTTDKLLSIQRVQYFGTIEMFEIRFYGVSTQESELKIRLEEHFHLLTEMIPLADQAARKVLQDYITLVSTTDAICQSSLHDQQRLLIMKEQAASQLDWIKRASIYLLGLSEPEDLATISQNVKLAQGIYEWAQDVVDSLQCVVSQLTYAKANIGLLLEIIRRHGTIVWDTADKDREIMEFLAQCSEAMNILDYNTAAWVQLQTDGYI